MLRWMMLRDMQTYLPDDILCKVDRAAMAVSLEGRLPMLDHRVAEAAMTLDDSMLVGSGIGKLVSRSLLARRLPEHLMARPKSGFRLPLAEWLRGPLREWAEDLLDATAIRNEGYLDADVVRGAWQRHVAGEQGMEHRIWALLMFNAWVRAQ
jgi:asparagine synthase (glutamine-hydrolysing)